MIYHRTDCKRSGVPGLSARPEWRRRAASAELCVCALLKPSLSTRTLQRSIYFLGSTRETAAEKTAGQDLAPLYPSVLFRSLPPLHLPL